MLHILVVLMSFFSPLSVWADEDISGVVAWVNNSQCQMEPYLEDAKQLKETAESTLLDRIEIERKKSQSPQSCEAKDPTKQANSNPPILIFVSLSMPKESLKFLYQEAAKQQLPLLIRGLKNNSFKETADALKELEIALQVDPSLFEEYEVKVVPTFVRVDKHKPLQMKGNISLQYVQQKFEEAL